MECKLCKQVRKRFYTTLGVCETCRIKIRPKSFLSRRYDYIKRRCTDPKHRAYDNYKGKLNIKRSTFHRYFIKDPDFVTLHEYWVSIGCPHRWTPSIDRINTSKGYSKSNMRVVPWWVNDLFGKQR